MPSLSKLVIYSWLCTLCLLVPVKNGFAALPSLQTVSQGLTIDPREVSVSGFSSGAFMALQLQVSYSSVFKGAGIIAGGPYRCAEGRYPAGRLDFTGLYAPSNVCTKVSPIAWMGGPPNVDFSIAETERLAAARLIDNPKYLSHSKIWLFSGGKDTTVTSPVMDSVYTYLEHYVPRQNIDYVQDPNAGHAMITAEEGSSCSTNWLPYINDCNFDAAGALLTQIYGPLKPKVLKLPTNALQPFDQQPFTKAVDSSVSMSNRGHIYIPASCKQGMRCRLHIALHGCQQSEDFVGDGFYTRSQYNEWAEANRLVILYPQARIWLGIGGLTTNPQGCWDWWGYSGDDYADHHGKQIMAIKAMLDVLLNPS